MLSGFKTERVRSKVFTYNKRYDMTTEQNKLVTQFINQGFILVENEEDEHLFNYILDDTKAENMRRRVINNKTLYYDPMVRISNKQLTDDIVGQVITGGITFRQWQETGTITLQAYMKLIDGGIIEW